MSAETSRTNSISGQIVDSALRVHSALGPGLLESAYHACLLHALRKRALQVRSQVSLPIYNDSITIDVGYRADMLVEESVLIELKTVTKTLPVHEAQLLSYLRPSRFRLGLLLNFHVLHFKDGIKRIVNNL